MFTRYQELALSRADMRRHAMVSAALAYEAAEGGERSFARAQLARARRLSRAANEAAHAEGVEL